MKTPEKSDFIEKIQRFVKWIESAEDEATTRSLKKFKGFLSSNIARIRLDNIEYASTSYGRYDGYDGSIQRIRGISWNLDEQYFPRIKKGIPHGYSSNSAYREELVWLRDYCFKAKKFAGKIAKNFPTESVPGNVSHLLRLSAETQHISKECISTIDFPKKAVVLETLIIIFIVVIKS